jgi:voltage-gated potassium channel
VADPITGPLLAGSDSTALALVLSLAGGGGGGELSYASLKGELKRAIANDPFDATIATVLGGSFLFYVAEKGHNPKVETYWDALVFISTCLSVGYADVFARTPAGKAIASAVMTFGPAMSGAILDGPSAGRGDGEGRVEKPQSAEATSELLQVQRTIVEKLDAILEVLRAERAEGNK